MESKKIKEWIDHGCGFPVRLKDVTMVRVLNGIWTPKINYNKLHEWVLLSLIRLARPLSGHEVRFIRRYFHMTLQEFSGHFNVSHQAVMKWEEKKDHPTLMSWSTEKDIRLFAQSKLSSKVEKLGELYEELTMSAADQKEAGKQGLGPVKVGSIGRQLAEAR